MPTSVSVSCAWRLDMKAVTWRCHKARQKDRFRSIISKARAPVVACSKSARQYPDHSPFSEAVIHRKVGEPPRDDILELNPENAEQVLEEIRPVLQADGGDVKVVSVEDGVVSVAMQGACGSCPSQSATLQMGIERALIARFGDKLKSVALVGGVYEGATVEAVDQHLSMLRPAIMNYGGIVEVVSVGDGVCTLKYKGPAPISRGIQAAIKENFEDIEEVVLVDAE